MTQIWPSTIRSTSSSLLSFWNGRNQMFYCAGCLCHVHQKYGQMFTLLGNSWFQSSTEWRPTRSLSRSCWRTRDTATLHWTWHKREFWDNAETILLLVQMVSRLSRVPRTPCLSTLNWSLSRSTGRPGKTISLPRRMETTWQILADADQLLTEFMIM